MATVRIGQARGTAAWFAAGTAWFPGAAQRSGDSRVTRLENVLVLCFWWKVTYKTIFDVGPRCETKNSFQRSWTEFDGNPGDHCCEKKVGNWPSWRLSIERCPVRREKKISHLKMVYIKQMLNFVNKIVIQHLRWHEMWKGWWKSNDNYDHPSGGDLLFNQEKKNTPEVDKK